MTSSMHGVQDFLAQLEHLEEAQREYVACMQTSASAAQAGPNAIGVERAIRPANMQDAWQDGCASSHPIKLQSPD